MASERYIVIPNWDEFQHYKSRSSPPTWIKLYPRLLRKDEFMNLTVEQRMALVGIWLLYSETSRKLSENTSKLSRQLGQRITKGTLNALNEAGFIEFRSRDALETVYARQDRELTSLRKLVKETETVDPPNGGLPFTHTQVGTTPAERLLAEIRDADERTAAVLHSLERRLPEADFVLALESLRYRRARKDKQPLDSEARYAVSTLTTMERERQAR